MKIQLKNSLLPLAVVASLLSGCASGPEVHAVFDRAADFTQYKTFAFASPLATDRGGYQSIISQELKANTKREMEARGMRLVETAPQLLVNFNASLSDKTRVSTMPVSTASTTVWGSTSRAGRVSIPGWQKRQPRVQPRRISTVSRSCTVSTFGTRAMA